jgi:NAD(P)-dependent dehydrogenase (short-subunit alcohol dehydrogenase family)
MPTVLVTGGSRGIGEATVKLFLEKGYRVIATSQSGGQLPEHQNLVPVRLHLASPASIAACVKAVAAAASVLDLLVSNAGALFDREDTTLDTSKLRQTLEVNLIGTTALVEQLLPLVPSNGRIIFLSSQDSALNYDPLDDDPDKSDAPAYRISKAGLNMYSVSLAGRLRGKGTVVAAIDPGWVRTDMGTDAAPRLPAEAAADIFDLVSRPDLPTGKFWRGGRERMW